MSGLGIKPAFQKSKWKAEGLERGSLRWLRAVVDHVLHTESVVPKPEGRIDEFGHDLHDYQSVLLNFALSEWERLVGELVDLDYCEATLRKHLRFRARDMAKKGRQEARRKRRYGEHLGDPRNDEGEVYYTIDDVLDARLAIQEVKARVAPEHFEALMLSAFGVGVREISATVSRPTFERVRDRARTILRKHVEEN